MIQVNHITKYFEQFKALDDLCLHVKKGSVYGLIGPNGAGKTTVFNMLTGVYKPTDGKIFLDGEDITGKSTIEINKEGIARTFQNIRLFSDLSVLDNVKAGLHNQKEYEYSTLTGILRLPRYHQAEKAMNEKAMELLKVFELDGEADYKASNLPYGKQRKLEIARALATNPKLLLLDEPAAGMNPNETHELLLFVKKLNAEGLTVVVIEHDLKFIMNVCDHIMVLNYGQKLCEGNAQEIQNNKQVQEAYFGKRAGLGGTEG